VDIAHRRSAELSSLGNISKIALDQSHAGTFHGDIGSGPHQDPPGFEAFYA
jgi:hypothetical protein